MDKSQIDFYKENPEIYIKEVLGFELFPWQIYVLKEYIKHPNTLWFVNMGRSPAKRLFWKAKEIIDKELI